MSAPKVGAKGTLKRKNDGKDDCPPKKGMSPSFGDKQQKSPSPPKLPRHELGKDLMTGKGLIALDLVHRLITHQDYIVEMVNSIMKKTDLDPCAEQSSEDLGAFSLFNLSRVCLRYLYYAA